MKTTYTDEELQAAIDAAFPGQTTKATLFTSAKLWPKTFESEARQRLAIAKAFLEKLESDPYTELKKAHAEGKVIQHRFSGHLPWNDTDKPEFLSSREYRIKPEPEPLTFEAHGKTWTKHKAGYPMPCDGGAMVEVLLGGEILGRRAIAKVLRWESYTPSADIIGWRYADEQPKLETPWTPAVGDIVQLKSGGPKMTVALLKETLCKCQWFRGDEADLETFEIATLQPVTK